MMATKRSGDQRASSSSTNTSPSPGPALKRQRISTTHDILSDHKIYIITSKLDNGVVGELHELVERSGAVHARSPDDADVIITAIGMRKRFERQMTAALPPLPPASDDTATAAVYVA